MSARQIDAFGEPDQAEAGARCVRVEAEPVAQFDVDPLLRGAVQRDPQQGTAGVLAEFRPDELAGYQRLLEVLEQRAVALELMRASLVSKRPFVRVGSEFSDPQLATVSLVGAPYGLQHRNLGTVSLVGPMRMDYVKAIDAVRTAAKELSRFVEDLYES